MRSSAAIPRSRKLVAASTLLLLAACATAPAPQMTPTTASTVATIAHLEERALLLLLADRKTYEPLVVTTALEGDADLHHRLALTLAHIGDPRGGPVLESLLGDPTTRVRRTAAFALGELGEQGYRAGAKALLEAVADADREVGQLAVEALGKMGVVLETVTDRLAEVEAEERLPRLMPSLFRFESDGVLRWAESGLESEDPTLRAMAAYGLARNPRPEGVPLLRPLLEADDPWIRGWAARALGQVGERADLERLRPLLDDGEPGPIIHALRAAHRLISDAKAAAPRAWKAKLLELLEDPRPGVRLTAIEASAAWLLDPDLATLLASYAASPVRRERELALLALAEGEDPQAAALVVRMAKDPDPTLRTRAAEAAGLYRAVEVLEQLRHDENPGVRRAALETFLADEPPGAAETVRAALEDADPTVRAAALRWAEGHPVIEMEALLAAIATHWRDRIADARIAGVRALGARAEGEPRERGAIIAALEGLAGDRDYLIRREAARALEALEREPAAVGAARDDKPTGFYRQIIRQTRNKRQVDVETEHGTLSVELDCPTAPLTCLNFLQLAAQGFYDGLTFHRVVPDFVVQGGDPRGDGAGGPGYTIRDEMNPRRYRRGTLGMALSGPDTGGSQFFITLSPQPHLDGGYTAFGQVVAGEDVLDRILEGDRILRIVENPG